MKIIVNWIITVTFDIATQDHTFFIKMRTTRTMAVLDIPVAVGKNIETLFCL